MLCLFFFLIAVAAFRRASSGMFPIVFAACTAGVFAGTTVFGAANRAAYPEPAPHTRYTSICFDRQYSHFELPDRTLVHEPQVDFHTLYTWVQRVGFVPRVSQRIAEAVAQDNGLVMLNPSGPIAPSELRRLRSFVESGGVLFVLDSPRNQQSNAAEILGVFSLSLDSEVLQNQTIANAAGQLVAAAQTVRPARGGTGLLFAAGRKPALARCRVGKGAVVFSGDAELFANSTLGMVGQVPNEALKRLYDVIFQCFREVEHKEFAGSGQP